MDTYRIIIDKRISDLLANRRWYRANAWAHWSDLRKEDDAELRALLKLARTARKMAAADPIDAYKAGLERGYGYHDVQAWNDAVSDPVFREAVQAGLSDVKAGRTRSWPEVGPDDFNIEGAPEFNGAFR